MSVEPPIIRSECSSPTQITLPVHMKFHRKRLKNKKNQELHQNAFPSRGKRFSIKDSS